MLQMQHKRENMHNFGLSVFFIQVILFSLAAGVCIVKVLNTGLHAMDGAGSGGVQLK